MNNQFRVWSKEKKCFDETPVFIDRNGELYDNEGKLPNCNYIIQFFTGMQDANRKNIFEGDIVKDCNSKLYTIVFWEQTSSFGGDSISNDIESDMLSGLGSVEVIGNTMQNPEMLRSEW